MADETKKETKVDIDALNSAIDKGEEETKDEVPQEVMDSMKDFDAKIDSDDDSAIEDTSDETPEEEEKADEKIPVEKEVPAGEKDVEAEIAKIEKQSAEPGKVEKEEEPEEKVETKVETEKKDEDKPYDCGLDPDEYDEGYIKATNEMGQKFTDEIKGLKSEKNELISLISNQNSQRFTDWLDRKIDALGDEFVEIYGEGEFDDIEPASEQFENRAKLDKRIAITTKAYQSMGKPVPSRNKLFSQAVSYLHKDIVNKSKTDKETIKKLAERKGQVIGKASKKGSTTSALERSAQVMKDFDKKIDED